MENDNLTGKSFIKKLIGFSTASWISAAISLMATPLITRMFTPSEVGKINLFSTFMVLFQTISILGLDQAFMRFYNEPPNSINKKSLLGLCMSVSISMSVLCSLVMLIAYSTISIEITGKENFFVIICLIITVFSSVALRMTSIASRMEQKIGSYTIQTISISLIEKVIFVLVAFYRANHIYAITAISFSYLFVAILFLIVKRNSIQIDLKIKKDAIKQILYFAIPYTPVLLLSWLNNSIPQFILKRYVDYGAIGIYTNAVSIANILSIIQTGFNVYWAPFVYENYKSNKRKVIKVHQLITAILIIAAVGIVLTQDVIYLLLGERFRGSRLVFPFLLLSPISNSISDTTGVGIMLSKKSYLNIFSFLGSACVNIIISILLVPKFGILGASIAAGFASIMMLIIRTYIGSKFYRLSKNYNYLFFSFLILLIVASINVIFSNNIIVRNFLFVGCLAIIFFIYSREFLYLFNFAKKEVKALLGGGRK